MTIKDEKKGVSPETAEKIVKYVGGGMIFACGAAAGALGMEIYLCGKIINLRHKADEYIARSMPTQQDLLNMLTNTHSKDEMFNIMSKLLYSEVQKTDAMLKDTTSPDLLRLSRLQKASLRDVQEVIKVRAEKNQDEVAIKKAEVKFQESFIKLQTYVKEQTLRSLGMHEGELIQKQGKMNNAPILVPQSVNTR